MIQNNKYVILYLDFAKRENQKYLEEIDYERYKRKNYENTSEKKAYCKNCKYHCEEQYLGQYNKITILNNDDFTTADLRYDNDFCIKNFNKTKIQGYTPICPLNGIQIFVEDCNIKNCNNQCSDYKRKWWKFWVK